MNKNYKEWLQNWQKDMNNHYKDKRRVMNRKFR